MTDDIVITGIGMFTPLGTDPGRVLHRILNGDTAASAPEGFDAALFGCPVCAAIRDFDVTPHVSDPKMIRLMNRDAQLAVAAARCALQNAGIRIGTECDPGRIGLFGAAGMAGLALAEVSPMLRASVTPEGRFDLNRFGQAGRRAVSPTLSFKILPNMPVCFVAINEGIQGPNSIYAPWEGHGARAIEAGMRALRSGDVDVALVGGSDVKCHVLAFAGLSQFGLFDSWKNHGTGIVPGEGAVFLVMETGDSAVKRGAAVLGRLKSAGMCTFTAGDDRTTVCLDAMRRCLGTVEPEEGAHAFSGLISAANGDPAMMNAEASALSALHISGETMLRPKQQAGDLFAAAGFLQVALGVLLARERGGRVLADCFGHGSGQAAFLLQAP
jgi:3-oxoacyl-[acyl-carrier-protein] synthase II